MDNVFVVRPFSSTSIGWWYAERDQIDLSPSYQRKSGVWSNKDKAFLIDSIINGYDIPKFYVADFSYSGSRLNFSGRPYAVIDGRQRFEAIFDFLDGKYHLNDDILYIADPQISLRGMAVNQLREKHPRILQRIENFSLSVMSVITDQADRINDLFVRLNRSKPLTGAEVRSAMTGEVSAYIRRISSGTFFSEFVGFSNNRKQHENVVAKLLLMEHRGGFVETKKTSLDRFVEEALLTESGFSHTANAVETILSRMENEFLPKDSLLKSSGILPVYYWLVRNEVAKGFLVKNLKDFDSLRKNNPLHPGVVVYNSVSRSTNDELSYKIRYAVLERFIFEGASFKVDDIENILG